MPRLLPQTPPRRNALYIILVSLALIEGSRAFLPERRPHLNVFSSQQTQRSMAPVDLGEIMNAVSSTFHHLPHAETTTTMPTTAIADAAGQHASSHFLDSLLSTMYATLTADDIHKIQAYQEAHPQCAPSAHVSGNAKSVLPSARALIDVSVRNAGDGATEATKALPEKAQALLRNGCKVMDSSTMTNVRPFSDVLPGFEKAGGFLGQHTPIPEQTAKSLEGQFKWSAGFLNVIDKLPYAAILYGIIEFNFLRNDVDLYKEDIEDDPAEALAETIAVTSVRLAVFAAIALVTVILFGRGTI